MTKEENVYKQYFTPKRIANLLVTSIPKENFRYVVDLAVGDGELLKAVHNKYGNAILFGADIDSSIIENLDANFLNENLNLWTGDSLNNDIQMWEEYQKILKHEKFSLVVANPPFNYFTKTKFSDNKNEKYPIEIKFLLKYIDIVKYDGYIAIILPNGVLTNSNNNSRSVRRLILEETHIHCVIQLYRRSFKKVDADISILILRKKINKKMQKLINLKKVDENFSEQNIYIDSTDGVERLDFDYYNIKEEISKTLDNIPYEIAKLKDIVGLCRRGRTITDNNDYVDSLGSPFIHTTNIDNILIDKRKLQFIKSKYDKQFEKAKLQENDVLVARVGSNCIKKVGVVTNAYKNSFASDCLFILRDLKVNPYYLAIVLKSKLGYNQLYYSKRGSCSKFITIKDLLNIYIPIIPTNIQNDFERNIKKIANLSNKNKGYDDINKEINNQIKIFEKMVGCNKNDFSVEVCASAY